MKRRPRPRHLLLVCLSACACADGPTALDIERAPGRSEPELPPPSFLIGNSPLLALLNTIDGNGIRHDVQIEFEANRGIVESKAEDRFLIRTSVSFSKDGTAVASIGSRLDKPEPVKEDELRRGGSVLLEVCVQIPAPEWDAIVAATPVPGDLIDVRVRLELLLVDGNGAVHVLDAATVASAADPRDAR